MRARARSSITFSIVPMIVLLSTLIMSSRIQRSGSTEPLAAGWSQTYGGTDCDYGTSVVQTKDGGYALAGDTYSYGNGCSDLWLVKTDVNGVIPEFPLLSPLALLMVVTLLMLTYARRVYPGETHYILSYV
jgi:hypothetical protein